MFANHPELELAACGAIIAFAATSVLACTPVPPSAIAESVRITKEVPEGCRELGEVYGSGGGGGYTSADRKLSVARNEIREQTAAMGGNWVVMDAINADRNRTSIAARAFHCSARRSVPPGGAYAMPESPEEDAAPTTTDAAGTPANDTIAPPAAQDGQPARSAEERLTELKNLHDKELITTEEYEKRKAAILDEM